MRKLIVLAVVLALVLGGLGLWAYDRAEAKPKPKERHPHIYRALKKLEGAKRDLLTAARDFQGHRRAAVGDIDRAINQLRMALRSDRR
jgi:hypothetical protein